MTDSGSLFVRGGELVHADGRERADVVIVGGRIAALGRDLPVPEATEVVDATGSLVIPGGIDVHTHFDGVFQGATAVDDFWQGGVAATAGGITTHIDMCIPEPGEPLGDALRRWHAKAAGRAVCDYSFHVAVTPTLDHGEDELAAIVNAGCPSFKLFTAYDGLALPDEVLFAVMRFCAGSGALPIVHAENHAATTGLTRELVASGRTEPRWHPRARPPAAEGEATARVIRLAALAGSACYIAHVTCREALDAVAAARLAGQEVFAETEPQYLALTDAVYEQPADEAARYLCSPPIRSGVDQQALKRGLASGVLTGVASDHCAISLADRIRIGQGDFSRMPNGIGTIEHVRPVLWTTCVEPGHISAERFVDLTSTAPARTFGLTRKGRIAPGFDADLVLWDAGARWTATQASAHSALDYCVLEGCELTGRAALTIRRGEIVWDGRESPVRPGSGRFIPRAARPAVRATTGATQ